MATKPKIGSDSTAIRDANGGSTPGVVTIDAGGTPSSGTPADKRLKENKATVSH
jgi:hypothetical protein